MEITTLILYLKNDKDKKGIPDTVVQVKCGEEVVWICPENEFGVVIRNIEKMKEAYQI